MRVFVYEYVTGGGFLQGPQPPDSLLREGRAMLEGLATDFAKLPGTEVFALADQRLCLDLPGCEIRRVNDPVSERDAFEMFAARADWTVVIAPEFDRILQRRCGWVERSGGRLLGPPSSTVALAADKQRTALHLASVGISVPSGILIEKGECLPEDYVYPAVLKPVDGAGSQNICLIADREAAVRRAKINFQARLEPFISGLAASVAVLCGPQSHVALEPCRQHLSENGRFEYLGGSLPLEPALSDRARNLASRAIRSFDASCGYVGVDLILGLTAAEDVVVEINPRLTTSYVGLRVACQTNLAGAMLRRAGGDDTKLPFSRQPLEFDAGGVVRTWPQPAVD